MKSRLPEWNLIACVVASLLVSSTALTAQEPEMVILDKDTAFVVARMGSATVFRSFGPYLENSGKRSAMGSYAIEPLRYEWIMVQDSTLGLVYEEASGVKTFTSEGRWYWDGDLDLIAVRPIRAFEVRFMTFNIWREFSVTLKADYIKDIEAGKKVDFGPGWSRYAGDPEMHKVSICYIYRVLYPDGTVVVADLEPVLQIAKTIDESVTYQDLTPEPDPEGIRALTDL